MSRGRAGSECRGRALSALCPRRCRRVRMCLRGSRRVLEDVRLLLGSEWWTLAAGVDAKLEADSGWLYARRTFRRREMNDIAVALEHVHLLNCLNWLHIEFLQGCLELLVVCTAGLVHFLDLASRCALATVCSSCQPLCKLFLRTTSGSHPVRNCPTERASFNS